MLLENRGMATVGMNCAAETRLIEGFRKFKSGSA